MPDTSLQLRSYVDAVAAPVSADEARTRLRASTNGRADDVPPHPGPRRIAPIALAAAFIAVLVTVVAVVAATTGPRGHVATTPRQTPSSPDTAPTCPSGADPATCQRVTVTTGADDSGTWKLDAFHDAGALCLELHFHHAVATRCGPPPDETRPFSPAGYSGWAPRFVVGAVRPDAAQVLVDTGDGVLVRPDLVDVPTGDFGARFFVAHVPDASPILSLVARDAAGQTIGNYASPPGIQSRSPSPPPDAEPLPSDADAQAQIRAAFDQNRIGVVDMNGDPRGFIPTSWWFPMPGDEPPPRVGPVVDANGTTTGYWVREVGFVERRIVEASDFDVDKLIADWQAAELSEAAQRRVTGTAKK
jgi:hypothetical protein